MSWIWGDIRPAQPVDLSALPDVRDASGGQRSQALECLLAIIDGDTLSIPRKF